MADFHLGRDGEELGVFPEHEIREGLLTGRFLPSDLAWTEGMPDWVEIAALEAFVPQGPAGAPPIPPAGTPGAADGSAQPPIEDGPPFEVRGENGLLIALLTTVTQVLTQPRATFATMKRSGGFGPPILFLLVVGWPMAAISTLLIGDPGGDLDFLAGLDLGGQMSGLDIETDMTTLAVFAVIGYPLAAIFGQFFGAGLAHAGLLVVGGARHGFETTFRVSCYTSGAASVLNLLPVLGPLLVLVWGGLICQIVGLSAAHGISLLRAATAVLVIPVLFIVILFAGTIAGLSF